MSAALAEEGVKLVATDGVLVRFAAAGPVADLPERKLYLKAKWVSHLPEIGKLLTRAKLENMVTARDGCHVDHPGDECPLDRGAAVCVEASAHGRAMIDPYWLGGALRHTRRTAPALCVLLVKDPVLPTVKEVPAREAARLLASGQLPGATGFGAPFLNPHLAGLDMARQDLLAAQHERLFTATRVVLLNTAIGSRQGQARALLDRLH
ncbi:MAG: hypothetical protein HRF46_16490 [Acidobacteriota bacterium]